MPVIPHGVPPFQILSPCTIGDNGAPSDSLRKDADRVFLLIEDERHLTAETLLTSVQQRMQAWETRRLQQEQESPSLNNKKQKTKIFNNISKKDKEANDAREKEAAEMQQLNDFFASKHAVIKKLKNRCRLFRRAQQDLNENEDWTLASKHFGITTYYRREEDQSLSLKLEGEVKDAALFEQVCVLKEVDLHYKWSPFCTSSLTIADLDKLDIVGWFFIGMPKFGMARDGCYRAVGCDNIEEDGSILLVGQGIQDIMPNEPPPEDTFLSSDPVIEKLNIPPVPKRLGSGRMTIRKFEAVIHITSPTSCNTRIVANINPNISFIPNSLLEFIMKHLAGVLLAKLQGASKKAALHPVTNAHAVKMREEREFYQKWLMAKFQGICESKGWEMPPVAAFHLSEPDLQTAARLKSHGPSRAQTFSGDSPEERRVIDSLAANSSSAQYATENTDNMSLLSYDSGKNSVWSNNPLGAYLREKELKIQRRKEEEIAAVRRRAAERLQPKELPSHKLERLAELKKAKNGRFGSSESPATSTAVDDSQESASLSHRFARRLYSHEPRTRFYVVLLLVCILFTMLHPEPLLRHVEFDPQASWRVLLLQDIGVIVYILLCALPHFLLCDVALVYSFDALELGSKTGEQMKKFYSDNVRLAVAAGSLGIVGVSVATAVVKVWARVFLWSVSQLFYFLRDTVLSGLWSILINFLEVVPKELRSTCAASFSTVTTSTKYAIATTIWAISVPANLTWHVLVKSNFVGKKIERAIEACISACLGFAQRANDFIEHSVDAFEGKISIVAWRMEAFHTSRSLFMYTAVFLLIALVLFHLSARSSRHVPSTTLKSATNPTHSESLEHVKSDVSSMSGDSGNRGPTQATLPALPGSQRYASIPEDNAVFENNHALQKPFKPDSDSASSARRRRFRFRDTKSSSSPLVTTGPINGTSQKLNEQEHTKMLMHTKSY